MNLSNLINLLQNYNVFLSGGAGVGKSYLTSQVIKEYEKNGKNVISLGSTGISAVNIGGYTLHSFFVFGIAKNIEELKNYDIRNKQRLRDLQKILKECDLIVIDEISMVSSSLMDMIYYRLFSLGFDGKIMVVGDFYQLPPIIKKDTSNNSLFNNMVYAFESSSWSRFNFKAIILEDVKRTDNQNFVDILNKIREGICDSSVREYLFKLKENIINSEESTYLFGRNIEADNMNKDRLAQLSSDENFYYWIIKKIFKVNDKKLENWAKNLPVNEVLHLKIGAKVIFTINQWGKFVNGEQGEVIDVNNEYIVVRSRDRNITVYRHDFELTEIDSDTLENRVVATLSQYPLKLAYAITIHKSQGMSLNNMVCNLDFLFAPSQLYVAISRSINPDNLKIEYSRSDFNSYLSRVIVKNSLVNNFYKGLSIEN